MAKVVSNLKYSTTHEWVGIEGKEAYVGISDYAQDSLGDVVYVEAAEIGDELEQNDVFGVIESVKAASDLISPISGRVLEVNEEVIDNPELINIDCYKNWILKVEVKDEKELEQLMNNDDYLKFINE